MSTLRQFDLTLEDADIRLSDGRTVNCEVKYTVLGYFEPGEPRTTDYPGSSDEFEIQDVRVTRVTAWDDDLGECLDIPVEKVIDFEDNLPERGDLEAFLAEMAR